MKMIIWDLDETLWHGTVFYDDVKLKSETKEILKQIDKLGIIQCVVSKNNPEDVAGKLSGFGIGKYFKTIMINWEPKHENIFHIIEAEKIDPKEVLFIDDDPVNRESVKQFVGCHVDYDTDLYEIMKYFDTERLVSMRQQRTRKTAETTWKGDFKEFLKTVNMEINIVEPDSTMIPRITNLANRTNELNATRNRYTEEKIKQYMEDENYLMLVAFMKDKFGDYGLIGEIIIEKKETEWVIQDMCISCRTMGRGVGSELLKRVIELAKGNVTKIFGAIKKTKENFRMPKLYEKHGFVKYLSDGDVDCYELNI